MWVKGADTKDLSSSLFGYIRGCIRWGLTWLVGNIPGESGLGNWVICVVVSGSHIEG